MPVIALDTLYREGGPDIQSSSRGLLKNFYLSSIETRQLLQQNLCSNLVEERRSAICVLFGLILRESSFTVDRFCDSLTIKCLILGLFASIENAETAMDLRCILQRHEAMELISVIVKSNNKNTTDLIEQHGILQFFARYQRLALSLKADGQNPECSLPTLDKIIVPNLPHYREDYFWVFVSFGRDVNLEEWERVVLDPIWSGIEKSGR